MGYTPVVQSISVCKEDLIKLFMDHLNLTFKIVDGDEVKVESVSAHESYYSEKLGYVHSFQTTVTENVGNQEKDFRATVEVSSKDNRMFIGTISYGRYSDDNMSEEA